MEMGVEEFAKALMKIHSDVAGFELLSLFSSSVKTITQGYVQEDKEMFRYGCIQFMIWDLMNIEHDGLINVDVQANLCHDTIVVQSRILGKKEDEVDIDELHKEFHSEMGKLMGTISPSLYDPKLMELVEEACNCKFLEVNKWLLTMHSVANVVLTTGLVKDDTETIRIGAAMINHLLNFSSIAADDMKVGIRIGRMYKFPDENYPDCVKDHASDDRIQAELNRMRAIEDSIVRPNLKEALSSILGLVHGPNDEDEADDEEEEECDE